MQQEPGGKRRTPFVVPILLCALTCSCQAWQIPKGLNPVWQVRKSVSRVWSVHKGLKDVRHGIEDAEGRGMEEAALYHLTVARSLLEAAETQYEEADFKAAAQFLGQAEKQLERAENLHELDNPVSPPAAGGVL